MLLFCQLDYKTTILCAVILLLASLILFTVVILAQDMPLLFVQSGQIDTLQLHKVGVSNMKLKFNTTHFK